MELNGVANIKILLEDLASNVYIGNGGPSKTFDSIQEQLNILERYMLAYSDYTESLRNGTDMGRFGVTTEPMWHEVRENPSRYPNTRERMEGFNKQMSNRQKGEKV